MNLSISGVSNFDGVSEYVNVSVQPSKFNTKSSETYKSKVVIKAAENASDSPEIGYESGAHNSTVIEFTTLEFLVQAEINNVTANDWFKVTILPPSKEDPTEPVSIPSRLHLVREKFASAEVSEWVSLERGSERELSFKFNPGENGISGIVNVSVYRVSGSHNYTKLESPDGLSVHAKPSCYRPPHSKSEESTIKINTTDEVTPREYVYFIATHFENGVLTKNWLTVNINQ